MGTDTRRAGPVVTRREFCAAPALLQGLSRSRPNVLLLMADQHRGDWMRCAGAAWLETPNLDRIAAGGVRFRHAYSTTPTCTPARAALLSGLGPWSHGMLGYDKVADKYPVEMPRVFSEAGYRTLGIGKMHWTPQRHLHGFDQTLLDESGRVESRDFKSDYRAWFASEAPNFDPDATGVGWNDYKGKAYVLPERLHPTRWTADCAVRFIESWQKPSPWFLKVSFARPHSPYDPPQRWWDRYENSRLPEPARAAWSEKYRPRNSNRDDIWHGEVDAAEVRRARQGYSGSISFVDEQIGRVVEALEKRRWLDETVIVYLSDHGDMQNDHFLWRKSYAYEPSARIPMLLRGPGIERGRESDVPVEIRDVLPTLAAAAGIDLGDRVEGRPMTSVQREWIDLEHDVCYDKVNHWNALTDGRWKYIYHAFDGSEQLFDLSSDPYETRESSDGAAMRLWRGRMAEHLAPRGPQWVQGGKLLARPAGQLRSPNYPG